MFDTAWDETRNANRAAARTGLFKYLDADSTETIELAEVLARIEFDADADGQVTPEEANTFFDMDADGELNETEAVMTFERFEDEKCVTKRSLYLIRRVYSSPRVRWHSHTSPRLCSVMRRNDATLNSLTQSRPPTPPPPPPLVV